MFKITQEVGFDFLSAEYGRLFEEAGVTAFQHPIWLDRLYRILAPAQDAEPVVVTAREGGPHGRLRMLLPLVRRRRRGLRLIEFADLEVCDYACPVVDQAVFRVLAGNRQVQDRLGELLRPYDVVRIKKIPEGAAPLEQILPASRRSRLEVSAHAAPLAASFADWQAAAMPASYVKELAKKRRRLSKHGRPAFELLQDRSLIVEAFDQLRGWRAKRYPDDLLQQPAYHAFYLEVALAGAESGLSRTFRLALDGRTIGVVWVVCCLGSCSVLMGGFDFDAHAGCSIGSLAYEDLARDCVARGERVLDFALGDEPYKQLFGCAPRPLWTVTASGTPLGVIANSVAPHLSRRSPKAEGKGLAGSVGAHLRRQASSSRAAPAVGPAARALSGLAGLQSDADLGRAPQGE